MFTYDQGDGPVAVFILDLFAATSILSSGVPFEASRQIASRGVAQRASSGRGCAIAAKSHGVGQRIRWRLARIDVTRVTKTGSKLTYS